MSHGCWLPNGGYVYVTRPDSVLWHASAPGEEPVDLTLPSERELPPTSGPLESFWFRYVQGLYYSSRRQRLLVGDASLGAIFSVDLEAGTVETLAGRPSLSDSSWRSRLVHESSPEVWLGAIRCISEDQDGDVVFVNGEDQKLYALKDGKLKDLGVITSGEPPHCVVGGCGLTLVDA